MRLSLRGAGTHSTQHRQQRSGTQLSAGATIDQFELASLGQCISNLGVRAEVIVSETAWHVQGKEG